MIRPTPRLIALLLAASLPALIIAFAPAFWPVWAALCLVVLALAAIDWTLSIPHSRLNATLHVPPLAALDEPIKVGIDITPALPRGAQIQALLDLEGPARVSSPSRLRGAQIANTQADTITLTPERRGTVHISGLWLAWTGPLGLIESTSRRPQDATTSILPNVAAVQRAALRLSTHHTYLTGVKTRRMLGDGSEFEALRQYMPGLDHRMIDWKASAKHRKLLWRENRSERNHRVIIALDAGRLMSEPIDDVPRLDHAINAGMLLAYLALRSGDQVGLMAFDSEVRAFAAPTRGVNGLQPLMNTASKIDYSFRESNYTLAITDLNRRLPRRSVVVVLTDFVDPIAAQLMVENIHHLAKRHLVVFVSLRDPSLEKAIVAQPNSAIDVNRSVVAYDLRIDREQVLQTLRRRGVHCIDAAPNQVTLQLLNKYLEIQRRELL